ncbi:MAG TPA: GAF domain-containing sensor histidine kinase, partial [Longimicrobiaceae bacterium]|nr:GAF domain-containing sensor histidine kinase [Longimicrobiaceae bacterium]
MPVEPNLRTPGTAAGSVRELRIVGEIAQAFLTSESPEEVYRLALERVTPIVGASFSCVFLHEYDSDLLRIVAEYNWPAQHSHHVEEMRVRVGNGPTGRAVLENAAVEVANVFAEADLEDWWDAARELGFTSSIALPLAFESKPVGALTFYFEEQESFQEADRHLLLLVSDQLAATAEKAHLIDDLQKVNEKLVEQNVDLEIRCQEAEEARQFKNEFLANISHELRTPLTAILGYTYLLKEGIHGKLEEDQELTVERIEDAGGQLVTVIDGLLDLTNLRLGKLQTEMELCDAVALARAAIAQLRASASGIEIETVVPATRIPVHTDPIFVQRVLQSLLSN